jgi:Ferritin-like domain
MAVLTQSWSPAAPLITSKTYLAAAAAIMATEAQHSGSLRLECILNHVTSPAVDSLDVPPTESTPYDVDKNRPQHPANHLAGIEHRLRRRLLLGWILSRRHERLHQVPVMA